MSEEERARTEAAEHDACVASAVAVLVERNLLVVSTLPHPYGPERYLRTRVEFELAVPAAHSWPRLGTPRVSVESHLPAPNGYLDVVTPGRARGWSGSYAEHGGVRSAATPGAVERVAREVHTELPRALTNAEVEALTRARAAGLPPGVLRGLLGAPWSSGVFEVAYGLVTTGGDPGRLARGPAAVEVLRDLADGTPLEWVVRRSVPSRTTT